MAQPDANDTVIDPDLDAQFSHLSMSTPSMDGTNTSSLWPAQDQSFYPQAAATGFEATSSPLVTDPLLAAQTDPQQHSFDYGQYLDNAANQPYWPANDDSAQPGPSSGAVATALPYPCTYDGCPNSYNRQCDLDKHINNHKKPRQCTICGAGGAEMKDLNRHMWAHHREEARRLGVPEEKDRCPQCGYSGRKDNVKRHKDTQGHW